MNVSERVREILDNSQVDYDVLEHEPVYDMEQAALVCGHEPESGVKVLFVEYPGDIKVRYALVVWTGNSRVDFKEVGKRLGTNKIKLAAPESVYSVLGIEIGALSPFGYEGDYPVVLDRDLLNNEHLYINPGVHNKTIKLKSEDLLKILEGKELIVINEDTNEN